MATRKKRKTARRRRSRARDERPVVRTRTDRYIEHSYDARAHRSRSSEQSASHARAIALWEVMTPAERRQAEAFLRGRLSR